MNDIIRKHREIVSARIQQSFTTLPDADQSLLKADEYDDLEKARVVRQDGDIHPNGKWVWVSSAAGGKGDWRVIKKQKDGSSNAPASEKTEKKENKPSQEEVDKEMMKKTTSLNDFERKLRMLDEKMLLKVKDLLERVIESKATTKKEKEQAERSLKRVDKVMEENKEVDSKETDGEKSKSGSADVTKEKESGEKKEKERYYFDYGNGTLYLPDLKDQTINSLLLGSLFQINDVKQRLSLSPGKIKLKRLNELLERERVKFSQLKEEADRRGLKFEYKEDEYENGKKKKEKKVVRDSDGDEVPFGTAYYRKRDDIQNWLQLHAKEAWERYLGNNNTVIVAYMPSEGDKQRSFQDAYKPWSADDKTYVAVRQKGNNSNEEFEFFSTKQEAMQAAEKMIKQIKQSQEEGKDQDK
nr:MAG TPA: hypothetical protein [Caudoviricetes sp.]